MHETIMAFFRSLLDESAFSVFASAEWAETGRYRANRENGTRIRAERRRHGSERNGMGLNDEFAKGNGVRRHNTAVRHTDRIVGMQTMDEFFGAGDGGRERRAVFVDGDDGVMAGSPGERADPPLRRDAIDNDRLQFPRGDSRFIRRLAGVLLPLHPAAGKEQVDVDGVCQKRRQEREDEDSMTETNDHAT